MKSYSVAKKSITILGALIMFCLGSLSIAAPRYLITDFAGKQVIYQATGYSQVEYAWPKSGVICRHNQTHRTRTCNNLKPGEKYQIIDFHDQGKRTFQFPRSAPSTFNCNAGSSGNLKNVRYGLNRHNQYYITWERKKPSSWIQLQQESPIFIVAQGMGNIRTRLGPDTRYRLDDLTYGGRIFINMKRNGC